MAYSFERFKRSRWSLVILSEGRIIFKSRARSISPLIRYLESQPRSQQDSVIFDKYVGRAAALLMVLIAPIHVHTPVISEGGDQILSQYGIPFTAERTVKYLMGEASEDMCRWEKASSGKTPEAFWQDLDYRPSGRISKERTRSSRKVRS